MSKFWEGLLDITGDVIEFALPTAGTLFGPMGRIIGGAAGNLIDEALDGDIHSFSDAAEGIAWGAGEAWFGGMLGGAATKLAGKFVPPLGKLDMTKGNLKLTGAFMKGRINTVLNHPIEIGKGIGASATMLVADIIRGPSDSVKPVGAVKLPVRPLIG
ncbi:hypothetical protein [Nocardia brasiliensis]|uniref:hypothetical protein n=1 Tax=Nocardia brasiliensis TaxID=37326 RepID=UPI0024542DC1|nr:hypothetical protein [Nocardia brasiliensis]